MPPIERHRAPVIAGTACGLIALLTAFSIALSHGPAPGFADARARLQRQHLPGERDLSFGSRGLVTTRIPSTSQAPYVFPVPYPVAVLIQSDSKIVVVGHSSDQAVVMVRYETNGDLDASFGNGGIAVGPPGVSGQANAAALQAADGRIVGGGETSGDWFSRDMLVMRFLPDG